MITTEKDIELLVRNDDWMMGVLRAAELLGLPDWWIGAGFLRNKVWDAIEGNEPQKSRDVDLAYYDHEHTDKETDVAYDEKMNIEFPFAEWEVRNQARMHIKNGCDPYTSTADGIAHWVETATCVAVRLHGDVLEFLYCHGSEDLLKMIARPVADFRQPERIQLFRDRITNKQWRERWPHLTIIET